MITLFLYAKWTNFSLAFYQVISSDLYTTHCYNHTYFHAFYANRSNLHNSILLVYDNVMTFIETSVVDFY